MARLTRFRCESCGSRLALHGRHLGRLVTCPQCGQVTHPVAAQIAQQRKADNLGAVSAISSTSRSSEQVAVAPPSVCANCGQGIGKLQKLNLWNNQLVCAGCFDQLANESQRAAALSAAAITAASNAPSHRENILIPSDAQHSPRGYGNPARMGVRPMLLAPRTRGGLALVAFCVAGSAVYGALGLLRDMTGILTVLAFVVLAIVTLFLLLRRLTVSAQGHDERHGGGRVVVASRESSRRLLK